MSFSAAHPSLKMTRGEICREGSEDFGGYFKLLSSTAHKQLRSKVTEWLFQSIVD